MLGLPALRTAGVWRLSGHFSEYLRLHSALSALEETARSLAHQRALFTEVLIDQRSSVWSLSERWSLKFIKQRRPSNSGLSGSPLIGLCAAGLE